jgi:two-component system NtrC family sensor kinase
LRARHRQSGSPPLPGDASPRSRWPVVAAALRGQAAVALSVFDAPDLELIGPPLRERARLAIVPTENARPDPRVEEERGMVIHVASPVFDAQGRQTGVLEGGQLLNRNLDFVDTINDLVYNDGALPLGSRGTATLFLDDVRIATNVRMFGGDRALGTRVSAAVRHRVLDSGERWLDRAFVVNDWYVSGYEPVIDGDMQRVGMLYVGFLEAPFREVKQNILAALIALFALIVATGVSFRCVARAASSGRSSGWTPRSAQSSRAMRRRAPGRSPVGKRWHAWRRTSTHCSIRSPRAKRN